MAITNEDFQDRANQLMRDLAKQTGNEIIGCAMFFLSEDNDDNRGWTVIHNYNGEVSTFDFLKLYEAVCGHTRDDFLDSIEEEDEKQ